MSDSSGPIEELKFFLASQVQSFAGPLLSLLLDQKTNNRKASDNQEPARAALWGECREQLVQVSSAALKNEEWALKMFDSNGRLQSGTASGSLCNLMGSYDQCNEVSNASFCVAHISLETRHPLPFEQCNSSGDGGSDDHDRRQLVWFGFCAPSGCNANNITYIARQLLNSSRSLRSLSLDHIDCHRQQQQQQQDLDLRWRTSSILSIVLLFVVVVATIVASALPIRRQGKSKQHNHQSSRKSNLSIDTLLLFVNTFSLSRNANKLMQKRKQVSVATTTTAAIGISNLAVIDGLRVISIIWIIIIHSYNFAFQWLWFDNSFQVRNVYKSIWLQWIANGTFSLDNLFVMSGFLAHLKLGSDSGGRSSASQMLKYILRRYLRLAPIMLALILLSVALFPSLSSLSFNMANTSVMFGEWCEKNWFLNAILLQNWIRTPNQCFGHAWFVAVNFQMMLSVQFLFYLLSISVASSHRKFKMLLLLVCLFASQFVSATLVYVNQLQAMPLIPAGSVEKLFEYYRLIYIKPYYWFSSYTIGMLLAAFILEEKKTSKTRTGTIGSRKGRAYPTLFINYSISMMPILVMSLILLSLYPNFVSGSRMSNLEATLYVLLLRPLWSACVASLIYLITCQPNRDVITKTLRYILSLKLWLPLSRLSYISYLIHPALMAIFYGSATSAFHYSSLLIIYFTLGNIVLTFAIAFVLHLLLEIPIQKILAAASDKIWDYLLTHFFSSPTKYSSRVFSHRRLGVAASPINDQGTEAAAAAAAQYNERLTTRAHCTRSL